MRSTEFVTEKRYEAYEIESQTIMTTLLEHCRESFLLINKPIWRGTNNKVKPAYYFDPTVGLRKSRNTSNHYTSLIDESPYFEGWPKRSQSLICSTSQNKAESYSWVKSNNTWSRSVYAIFPFDGVKVAVCPRDDIWSTNITIPEIGKKFIGGYALDSFNDFLEYTLKLPDSVSGMKKVLSKPEYKKFLTKPLRGIDPRDNLKLDPLSPMVKNPLLLIDAFQRALSPQNAKFQLLTPAQIVAGNFTNREVWIGGPCLAINADVLKKFQQKKKKI